MAGKDYSDIYEAIRVADKEGRVEDVKRLTEYLDEQTRLDTSTMTPKELPMGQKLPSGLIGVGAAGTGATLNTGIGAYRLAKEAEARRTAKAITEALANQFGQSTSMTPPAQPTVGGIPVTPGAAQGSGAGRWNAQLGANFAGAQMDAESLARGKALNQIISQGGEFAGGSRTPAGIVLPPSATPLPGASTRPIPTVTPNQAPLSMLEKLYQGALDKGSKFANWVGQTVPNYGRAIAPVIEKGASIATPIIGWGGAGYNLADAYNRYQIGGVPDVVLPLTAAGSGITAMLSKNPRVAVPAAGYTMLEPIIQDYWDKVKRGEIRHEAPDYSHSDPMGNQYATGGLVYLQSGGQPAPTFNPEGEDYDYQTALSFGMGPTGTGDNQGHWGSVAPASIESRMQYGMPEDSYLVLKGRNHPTFNKAEAVENERGSRIVKYGDRYYSVPNHKEGGHATPAWQRKEGKNPEGGLNAKGRASYNRETGGNLKRPQPEGGARRDSFCARMKGMKKKLTSAKTANDPDSRINKSLRAWNC